ncbi:CBASS cGAMP-activated phospholipase [Brevundimonas diminuta]|uniref:CBASS cGAMP-activated phospholipase n=1 Tax=Brevundimonas diminuta TaxID=293 RepID=UPI0028AF6DA8|nr:CBASS cGAMP-activated phospholipase [Brevundimonas diminuta]
MFPASTLTAIERSLCGGDSAGRYFDLITGTSTGGIIALGLSVGLRASDILEMYREHGALIFPPCRGPLAGMRKQLRAARRLLRYSYEREPLEQALTQVLGDRVLGDAERRLCIPSFQGNFTEVHVFKTPHHPDFRLDWQERMVDVAMATAAAPTFFKTFQSGKRVFADGGVWANNPIMIGLVDALTTLDLQRRDVHILSLSCGDVDIPFTRGQQGAGGMLHWRSIVGSAMHLASQNATGQAGLLIGRDQLVRLEPSETGARIQMDDFDAANMLLPAEGERVAAENLEGVRHFFSEPTDPFEPFYGARATS